MTLGEALKAAEQGKKIKHRNFTDCEFFTCDQNGVLIDEKGYNMADWLIGNLKSDWAQNGWSIID